ncbi:MAG: nucleotidyltransferase family protein [Eubacteriales bacterium]|nr:nucleotidyltransferase family protein [Eubacteriales bacterium]
MKTAAVISEFNPFHNGHEYILKEARKLTKADYVIAIMSGNYVQRGEPAIFDKYKRAEMALLCGADLVIELPMVFAVSSAMEFARAGVMTAIKSDVVDYLVFGTENDISIDELKECASYLLNESGDFQIKLKEYIKKGMSYPLAREKALSEASDIKTNILKTSNNILALSYIISILEENSNIEAIPVKRLGDGYNDRNFKDATYTSATAIRNLINGEHKSANLQYITKQLRSYVPEKALKIYENVLSLNYSDSTVTIPETEKLGYILNYILINKAFSEEADFTKYNDISKEISDRLINTAGSFLDLNKRIAAVKTKNYTYTRIQRALLHIILNITDEEIKQKKEAGYAEYLRILGFRKEASPLLKAIKNSKLRESCPMITNTADYRELLKDDILRDNIYYSLTQEQTNHIKNEYERQIVII